MARKGGSHAKKIDKMNKPMLKKGKGSKILRTDSPGLRKDLRSKYSEGQEIELGFQNLVMWGLQQKSRFQMNWR